MAKDQTEVGITGKPIPKPRTAKQQYELEKKRRMQKHLGTNVGGTQYTSGAKYYVPSTSATNPRARTFEEFMSICEAKSDSKLSVAQKREVRTARSGLTGPHADYERRGAHRTADERSKDLADIRKGKKKDSSHFSYLP